MDYTDIIESADDIEPRYASMVKKLGLDAFLKLTEAYGGSQLYIPSTYKSCLGKIAQLVGEDYHAGAVCGRNRAQIQGIPRHHLRVSEKILNKRQAGGCCHV